MNAGHKHSSRWGFGDVLYHKMTGDKGMVTAIILRHQSPPLYGLVFTNDVGEKNCYEMELTEEQPTTVALTGPGTGE
jgi:hypothetical protein